MINPGETSKAELIETVPVAQSESTAARRVALHLGPGQLPSLAKGDRLITPAELQITTRCDVGQSAPGCNYNPTVHADLILTGDANDTTPGGGGSKLIASQQQVCTKDAHHCMFVFRPAEATVTIDGGFALPCIATNSCHVNLVVSAWDSHARSGGQDDVLVGGNNGDYLMNHKVDPDVARLMVVRERGVGAADRAARETSGGGSISVNTSANPVVIYSHRLEANGLAANEQFLVEARVVADVSSRVRVSTQLFLTRDPKATDGNGLDKISPGQISEQNGYNCSGGGGCVLRKVAVFHVDAAIAGPVYVNLVAKAAVPGGGGANVTVHGNDGFVRSVRYGAQLGR